MAVNFDALNQIYNHYLTEYAPKSNTPLDTHKKSDLRNIYNSIVKLNKESPLYILDTSAESKSYAVNLKESARSFRNAIAATKSNVDGSDILEQKAAYSTHPEIASVKYLGGAEEQESPPAFRLEVARLAGPQVNMGSFVPSAASISLPPDTYSFDVSIGDSSYEFQFQLREDDTNLDVQQRLSRLINNADIGMEASVLEDGEGLSSLKLESSASGTSNETGSLFQISDEHTSKTRGIVSYFGMDTQTREATNALFEINGIERTASSNTFTVEKMYEVTLNAPSPETGITTEIGLKNDIDSLSENIHALTDSYNTFLQNASASKEAQAKSSQLLSEIGYITRHYSDSLAAIGLSFTEDGMIQVDDEKLQAVAQEKDASVLLTPVKDFANSMLRKTNQISLNPMQYVNKTIVAYKNPGKNFAAPYITSAYSGMLFNNYC